MASQGKVEVLKTTALWSLTALCGVVGVGVWSFGGWTRLGATLTPIRITKTVWVTNEVSRGSSPWSEPLKPLDNPGASDDGFYTRSDGHRFPINSHLTNPVHVKSGDAIIFTNNMLVTNVYFNIGAYRHAWAVTNL